MVDFKFETGSKVRDRVSGYTGIIISRTEHMNGCRQYGVNAPVDDTGKMVDGYNIDEQQLELVDEGLNSQPVAKKDSGGATTPIKPKKI